MLFLYHSNNGSREMENLHILYRHYTEYICCTYLHCGWLRISKNKKDINLLLMIL